MELEIKHLVSYLPYCLKLQYVVRDKVEKIGIMRNIIYNEDETHPTRVSISQMYDEEHIWMFKPLLKPKTHLYKLDNEILIRWGDELSDKKWIKEITDNMFYSEYQDLRYYELEFMLENHIDVFGLIDNDLATEI